MPNESVQEWVWPPIAYLNARLGAPDIPGIAVAQPVVGELDLPAIMNLLVKHAELVANPVAHGGDSQCCKRVEITGGETA